MSKKVVVDLIVKGRVESSFSIPPTYILVESKSKRGRKKKLVLESEDHDLPEENSRRKMSIETPEKPSSKKAIADTSEDSQTKRRGRGSRKKKEPEEEELEEFPAPKSKPNRGRGQGKRGRPARKSELSSKDDTNSMISSSKNDEDSISQLDENDDMEEEDDMKLEEDDEAEDLEEDEDGLEMGFNPLSISTKNILRLTKGTPDESSSEKGTTDINNLNIDVNKLTRRQKAQLKKEANLDIDIEEPLLELPDKKSKKRKDELLTEEQQVKKMESANKRRMLNQKLQEEQKKQTINKILNEAGRKQKMRKEKEQKSTKEKESHKFRTLPEGEVGIKYVSRKNSTFLALPKDFNAETLFVDL